MGWGEERGGVKGRCARAEGWGVEGRGESHDEAVGKRGRGERGKGGGNGGWGKK